MPAQRTALWQRPFSPCSPKLDDHGPRLGGDGHGLALDERKARCRQASGGSGGGQGVTGRASLLLYATPCPALVCGRGGGCWGAGSGRVQAGTRALAPPHAQLASWAACRRHSLIGGHGLPTSAIAAECCWKSRVSASGVRVGPCTRCTRHRERGSIECSCTALSPYQAGRRCARRPLLSVADSTSPALPRHRPGPPHLLLQSLRSIYSRRWRQPGWAPGDTL